MEAPVIENVIEKNEEIELFKRLKRGDKKARGEILERNTGLVVNIALNFSRVYGIDMEDLVQEGLIGLLTAADRFDYTKGYKFSTYAVPYIKRNILRYVQKNMKAVSISVHAYRKVGRVSAAQLKLEQSRGEASLEEISRETGLPVNEVEVLISLREPVISLNQEIGEEADIELLDVIPDEQSEEEIYREYFKEELKKALDESFKILSERERRVLEMRYGLNGLNGKPLKLREIAEILNISTQRVRDIESSALGKLRNSYRAKKLLIDFL